MYLRVCLFVLRVILDTPTNFQILQVFFFLFSVSAFANLPSNITQGHDYLLVGWLIIRAPLYFITILSHILL